VRELRKRGSERGGGQLQYGRNIVAPSGNQAANGEHQPRPIASGETRLLAQGATFHFNSISTINSQFRVEPRTGTLLLSTRFLDLSLENTSCAVFVARDVKKPSKKQRTTIKKKPPPDEDAPAGVLAYLGEENLDLFKRDDAGVVLPQGRPRRRLDPDTEKS
jgi:hypothetical protein